MMKKAIVLLSLAALAATTWVALQPQKEQKTTITVFCAAGLKKPVEEIALAYQRETGGEVRLQYGGTGTLLSQIRVAKQGDLFIAADDGSLSDARKLGVTREEFRLVTQRPVIAVAKGNPKHVDGLAVLKHPAIKLALPNPEAASIGRVAKQLLGAQWDALASKAVVMKPTVTEIAADLSLGAVDAAIVWDSTVAQFNGLEPVVVPELSKHEEFATAAVLSSCTQPAEAMRFARYLSAPEKGGEVFAKHRFTAVPGDRWSARPDLILFIGSVNRRGIEDVLRQFTEREGISVTTTYNGCGILCAAMKTMEDSSNPKFPDVYYACDVCFVPTVAKQFPGAVILTEAEIVIATPKGNPNGIHTLADLSKRGLRVELCNAEQSTLNFFDVFDPEVNEPARERGQECPVAGANRRFRGEPDAHWLTGPGGGLPHQPAIQTG
jgi:molybdate transport system substrate-binding protein